MLKDKIKLALRISHDLLDGEITELITTARAEMTRAGVPDSVAEDTSNDVVTQAIKTYALYSMADDEKKAEGYFESWQYQLDNIRKSSWE